MQNSSIQWGFDGACFQFQLKRCLWTFRGGWTGNARWRPACAEDKVPSVGQKVVFVIIPHGLEAGQVAIISVHDIILLRTPFPSSCGFPSGEEIPLLWIYSPWRYFRDFSRLCSPQCADYAPLKSSMCSHNSKINNQKTRGKELPCQEQQRWLQESWSCVLCIPASWLEIVVNACLSAIFFLWIW